MTQHSQSFHERLNELLGTHTQMFLDQLRALYIAGDLKKILGLQVEKMPLQSAKSSLPAQTKEATAPEAVATMDSTVSGTDQAAVHTAAAGQVEQPVKRGRTISEYLQELRQKFATGTPVYGGQLLQSAQTA